MVKRCLDWASPDAISFFFFLGERFGGFGECLIISPVQASTVCFVYDTLLDFKLIGSAIYLRWGVPHNQCL